MHDDTDSAQATETCRALESRQPQAAPGLNARQRPSQVIAAAPRTSDAAAKPRCGVAESSDEQRKERASGSRAVGAGEVPGPVPVIGGGRRESAGTGQAGNPGVANVAAWSTFSSSAQCASKQFPWPVHQATEGREERGRSGQGVLWRPSIAALSSMTSPALRSRAAAGPTIAAAVRGASRANRPPSISRSNARSGNRTG